MKYKYIPTTPLQKFGHKVYTLLVDNFKETFYVGGVVRDLLLKLKIRDIDFTTKAKPWEIIALLQKNQVRYNAEFQKLGIVIVKWKNINLSISTFRTETYSDSRYPKVTFNANIQEDAQRRDFTINALYLRQKDGQILDFHKGLDDLKKKQIRFIGDPDKRILEDPLRIVRALRFTEQLNFSLENNTAKAIVKHFPKLKTITKPKLNREIFKLPTKKMQNELKKLINRKTLDFF